MGARRKGKRKGLRGNKALVTLAKNKSAMAVMRVFYIVIGAAIIIGILSSIL